jgi:hypothetical protein
VRLRFLFRNNDHSYYFPDWCLPCILTTLVEDPAAIVKAVPDGDLISASEYERIADEQGLSEHLSGSHQSMMLNLKLAVHKLRHSVVEVVPRVEPGAYGDEARCIMLEGSIEQKGMYTTRIVLVLRADRLQNNLQSIFTTPARRICSPKLWL